MGPLADCRELYADTPYPCQTVVALPAMTTVCIATVHGADVATTTTGFPGSSHDSVTYAYGSKILNGWFTGWACPRQCICRFGEALEGKFRDYAARCRRQREHPGWRTLSNRDLHIVSGSTDDDIALIDVSSRGLNSKQVKTILERADITANKNPIPGDSPRLPEWTGVRLGQNGRFAHIRTMR